MKMIVHAPLSVVLTLMTALIKSRTRKKIRRRLQTKKSRLRKSDKEKKKKDQDKKEEEGKLTSIVK